MKKSVLWQLCFVVATLIPLFLVSLIGTLSYAKADQQPEDILNQLPAAVTPRRCIYYIHFKGEKFCAPDGSELETLPTTEWGDFRRLNNWVAQESHPKQVEVKGVNATFWVMTPEQAACLTPVPGMVVEPYDMQVRSGIKGCYKELWYPSASLSASATMSEGPEKALATLTELQGLVEWKRRLYWAPWVIFGLIVGRVAHHQNRRRHRRRWHLLPDPL
jgi:hypothetical protein